METQPTPRYIVKETPPDYPNARIRYGVWDTLTEKLVQFDDTRINRSVFYEITEQNCNILNANVEVKEFRYELREHI